MAATNKYLAQNNKSGTGEATKKRDSVHRAQPRHRQKGQARALPMARMTEHALIGSFNAAPMGSRQQRMLWAAHKMTDQADKRGQLIRHLEEALKLADNTPARAPVLRNLTKQ